MDKKLMNVDDLVRQRLGGGEEPMRDGAWMRMNELLDKEQDERKPAFFFWRNTLSVASAVVVLGLGAYYMAGRHGGGMAGTSQLVASAVNGPGYAGSAGGYHAQPVPATQGRAKSERTAQQGEAPSLPESDDVRSSGNAAGTYMPNDRNVAGGTERTGGSEGNGGKGNGVANTGDAAVNQATNPTDRAETAQAGNAAATPATAVNNRHHNGVATVGVAAPTNNKAHQSPSNKGHHSTSADKLTAAAHAGSNADKAQVEGHKTADEGGTGITAATTAGTDATGTASNVFASAVTPKGTRLPLQAGESVAAKVAEDATAHNGAATINGTGHASDGRGRTHRLAGAGKHSSLQGTATTGGRRHTMPAMALASGGNGTAGKANSKMTNATPGAEQAVTTRERVVLNKLTLHQRYVKTNAREGYFSLDTISMERLTREQTVTGGPAGSAAKTGSNGTAETASTNSGAEATATANAGNDAAVHAAAEPATAVTTTKETVADKIKNPAKGSLTTAQKLSMAFNDMKSTVKGAQFSAGLTAGFNSTFFGPASFRGFQFGATGEFSFNDNFSVMGELKYFHRLNPGEYSLTDEYYTYTQQGGQYVKVTNLQTATFSAMHSLELPVSARYSSGNFTFYAGGNFAYNFALNADMPTTGTVQSTTVVAAPGTNESPEFSIDDLNGRFGIGYLFGMSYRLAPNFTIDLRNVQTVWDNSSTSAAKAVSGQLYRHPSFQISVGYKFSGKKEE